ncbi:MAG: hypothetical protein ACK4ZE_07805 [Sphingorhabdus sp.]
MSDTQPNRTKQIVIGVGLLLIVVFIAGILGSQPSEPLQIAEPLPVGRHQIVSSPSGIVLKIDTYDGNTHRLVNNPLDGSYSWELVSGGRD